MSRSITLVLLVAGAASSAHAALPPTGWPQSRCDAARSGRGREPVLLTPTAIWTAPLGGPLAGEPVAVGCDVFVTTAAGEVVALNAHDGSERWRIPAAYAMTPAAVSSSLALDDGGTLLAGRPADPAMALLALAARVLQIGIYSYTVDFGRHPAGPDLAPELVPFFLAAMPWNPLAGRPMEHSATPSPGDYHYELHAGSPDWFELGIWWTDGAYLDVLSPCWSPSTWPLSPEQGGRGAGIEVATGLVAWQDLGAEPASLVVPGLAPTGVVWSSSELAARHWSAAPEHGRLRHTTLAGVLDWEVRGFSPLRGGAATDAAGNFHVTRVRGRFAALLDSTVRSLGTAVESYQVDNGFVPQTGDLAPLLAPIFITCMPDHVIEERAIAYSAAPSPGDYVYTPSGLNSYEIALWDEDGNPTAVFRNGVIVQPAADVPPSVQSHDAAGAFRWRWSAASLTDELTPVALDASGTVRFATRSGDVVGLDPVTGSEVARAPVGGSISLPPAILAGGDVAVVTDAGEVVAVSGAAIRWRTPTGVPPLAPLTATSDGFLYAPGSDGVLRVIDGGGTIRAQVSLGGPAGAALTTAAVAADGWLFVGRDDGTLLGLAPAASRGRPDDLGNTLRAVREDDDAVFSWGGAVTACSFNLRRDPDPASPPTAPLVAQPAIPAARDVGIVPGPPGVSYYRAYGVECCAGLQGP